MQHFGGGSKCLVVPTKQIASHQTLVKVAQAHSNISHVHLQRRHQQQGHAGYAHSLDCNTIGTQGVLSYLFLRGQAMDIHPLPHQQSDSHPHINFYKALHGLAVIIGLVTPNPLPWCNTDGKMWLVMLLASGFSQLRPWLYSL